MLLPPVISYFIKIQIGLTILVPAYPGCHEKRLLNGCLSVIDGQFVGTVTLQEQTLLMPPWEPATTRFYLLLYEA